MQKKASGAAAAGGEKQRRWTLWKSSMGDSVRKGEGTSKEDMIPVPNPEFTSPRPSFITPPPPLAQAVLLAHRSALCIQTYFRGFLVSVLNAFWESHPLFFAVHISTHLNWLQWGSLEHALLMDKLSCPWDWVHVISIFSEGWIRSLQSARRRTIKKRWCQCKFLQNWCSCATAKK